MGLEPTQIELTARRPRPLPADFFPRSIGVAIWRDYGNIVEVSFPYPKTQDRWELTARDHVGFIPVSSEFTLVLLPKEGVILGSVFGMLEYVYRLDFLRKELIDCATFEDFYACLAQILAKRVLDRERQGLYRSYVSREEALRCVRGRIDFERRLRHPWAVELDCEFEEHTPDIEDNQILAWTLWGILQNGLCCERVRPTLRGAWRALQGAVSLTPVRSRACVGRRYNRLNGDYEPLHALCRFFLEHSGPAHSSGGYAMLPFLVNMASLFEMFVAEWLLRNLPQKYLLDPHARLDFGNEKELRFDIDLVLCDSASNPPRPLCVLDTKYKGDGASADRDIKQVVAYAAGKGCSKAALVYPAKVAQPFNAPWGESSIAVRTMSFDLSGNLESAGQAFKKDLLEFVAGE